MTLKYCLLTTEVQLEYSPQVDGDIYCQRFHFHQPRIVVHDRTCKRQSGKRIWDYEYRCHCFDDINFCLGLW